MKELTIDYGHEFIANRIKDELLIYDIWEYDKIESEIISDLNNFFSFKIEKSRNINTLSGGQRAVAFIVTLSWILTFKNIKNPTLKLTNIIESLTIKTGNKLIDYLTKRGINAIK